MRTIIVSSLKGGVGKTTTVVNLAAALAERGRRILVIDLDGQKNTTENLGILDDDGTALRLFQTTVSPEGFVRPSMIPSVDVIPATAAYHNADSAISGERRELILRKQLARLGDGRWDYVLIDCHADLNVLSYSAMCAGDELLIPVQAEYLALQGVASFENAIELVRARLNPAIRIAGVLVTMFDRRNRLCHEVYERVREHFGALTFEVAIRRCVRVSEAPSHQQSVLQYASKSTAARDYRRLGRLVDNPTRRRNDGKDSAKPIREFHSKCAERTDRV